MELEAILQVNNITINPQLLPITSTSSPKKSFEQLFYDKTGKDFNTFYKKYFSKLVWFIQKFNINSIDAEGLANDAFMRAFDQIEKYNPEFQFSTWLFNIGKKKACQYKKDQKKSEILFDSAIEDSDDNDPIQYYLKTKMDSTTVHTASQKLTKFKYDETLKEISKLDPKYKSIIELSDIQGKTYNEICGMTDLNLGSTYEQRLQTVKNRLHHGRLRLENNLKEKFKHIEKHY